MKTIRLTLELHVVLVAGIKYLSDMPQETIDKYDAYYCDTERKWITVKDISDLERATREFDSAENYTFIKVPTKEGNSALVERILNHFPGVKIESVEDLGFQAMVENSRKNTATTAIIPESFDETDETDEYLGSKMVKSLLDLANNDGDAYAINVAQQYQSALKNILKTGSEKERKAADLLMKRVNYVINTLI